MKKKDSSKQSTGLAGEVSRIKKILRKVPGLLTHIETKDDFIFMDIGVIKAGKQRLEVTFAYDANTTLVALATRALAAKYALKIKPPHYQAADGTCHFGEEVEKAYHKDLENFYKGKIFKDSIAERIFWEYESDTVH